MLIKSIRGFDSFLNKKSDRLSTFEVFFDAMSSLIDPKTPNQNETLQKITSQAEFDSIDELNAFFKRYFDFHNGVIAFLNDQRLEQNKINRLSKEIISTLDKENAPQILEQAIIELLLKICDVYSLDMRSADFEKDVRKTFNDDTVLEAFSALSALPHILYKNDDPDIELDKILGIAVSVVAIFDGLRKASIVSHGFDAVNSEPEKIGRNEPCPCKSGKKYKKCCMQKDKNPFAALEKIAPEKEPLSEKEVEEFYALWSRAINFINRIFCKASNQKYAKLYEKDENGRYALSGYAFENSHYTNVRRFADDNWSRLMDDFVQNSRLSQKNRAVIEEWKSHAVLKQFFSFEKNIPGCAIFWQIDENELFIVHRLYDDLQKILPVEPQSFETFLLPFKDRIITDGVYSIAQVHMGANMLKSVQDEYINLRKTDKVLQQIVQKRDNDGKIYRLKISLKGAKPPLWRRVELSSEISYYSLHMIIQTLFGWEGSHLYEFDTGHGIYIDNELDDIGGKDVKIFSIDTDLTHEGDKIYYHYDFGDNWEHEIKLEKILAPDEKKTYPLCTAGKRGDAIEDIGGIEMLNQQLDPEEKFDIQTKNRILNELFA